jgi:uncharacterized protein (TIGR01777 family)
MHVVISGATGLVGRALVPQLVAAGHRVSLVSRDTARARALFGTTADACSLDNLPSQFDAVVNLAGESVARRWTARRMREIRDSRVRVTARLRQAAENAGAQTLVSASAVGFYGDTGDREHDERSGPGTGFLAETSVAWESAAASNRLRVAIVRIGIVLGRNAPALARMTLPFRLFVGGPLAGGRQWMSWVHLDDVTGILRWALESPHVSGPVNATAPGPVTNAEFSRALARQLRRPCWAPVPGFVLRLVLGKMAQMILQGQRAVPNRTRELGYTFRWPELVPALADCLG